jgi:hypothetical protein
MGGRVIEDRDTVRRPVAVDPCRGLRESHKKSAGRYRACVTPENHVELPGGKVSAGPQVENTVRTSIWVADAKAGSIARGTRSLELNYPGMPDRTQDRTGKRRSAPCDIVKNKRKVAPDLSRTVWIKLLYELHHRGVERRRAGRGTSRRGGAAAAVRAQQRAGPRYRSRAQNLRSIALYGPD